jgi:hypothetical protein
MKEEYDFSNAPRGRFAWPDAEIIPPVHLEPEVTRILARRAEAQGTTQSVLVNTTLKEDIDRIGAE